MSVMPILTWPDAALQTVCAPVSEDVSALVADMFETMYDAPGRGLAAPQVGVNARLFVMDAGWKTGEKTPLVCVNPEIEVLDGAAVDGDEGCLSMPGVTVVVPRVEHVRLSYDDLSGVRHVLELEGAAARIAQHEADHLDGLMHFHRVPPEARAQALADWEALA